MGREIKMKDVTLDYSGTVIVPAGSQVKNTLFSLGRELEGLAVKAEGTVDEAGTARHLELSQEALRRAAAATERGWGPAERDTAREMLGKLVEALREYGPFYGEEGAEFGWAGSRP